MEGKAPRPRTATTPLMTDREDTKRNGPEKVSQSWLMAGKLQQASICNDGGEQPDPTHEGKGGAQVSTGPRGTNPDHENTVLQDGQREKQQACLQQ